MYDIISLSYEVIEEDTIGIVESVMFGSLSIIFGIALFGLKKKLGTIARAAGILEIIVGATLFCVILFWVGLILLIPANIFEIILLYRASRMKWI